MMTKEVKADDELPRAVQNGMSMEEYETWMFLADKTGLDEPYTYAVKQSDLTKLLRDYRKKHELQAVLDELYKNDVIEKRIAELKKELEKYDKA